MRRYLWATVCLLLSACVGGSDSATERHERLSAVRAAIVAHNYADAAEQARALVKQAPGDADARFELARAEALIGNEDAALDALDAAVRAGLANLPAALADPAFADLHNTDRFAAIAARAHPGRRPTARAADRIEAGEGRDRVSITSDPDGREAIRAGNVNLDTDF